MAIKTKVINLYTGKEYESKLIKETKCYYVVSVKEPLIEKPLEKRFHKNTMVNWEDLKLIVETVEEPEKDNEALELIETIKPSLKAFNIEVLPTEGFKITFKTNHCFMTISKSELNKGYQVDFITTEKDYRRQGHATTLYKLVKNLLKAEKVSLYHSNSRTYDGEKWVIGMAVNKHLK